MYRQKTPRRGTRGKGKFTRNTKFGGAKKGGKFRGGPASRRGGPSRFGVKKRKAKT